MEPPIHTEYFLSGGATIFTLIEAGANAVISLVRRTSMFGNMVVPPDSTVLVYRSRRISTSHFMIDSYANLWIPSLSLPIKFGLNRTWNMGQMRRTLIYLVNIPVPGCRVQIDLSTNLWASESLCSHSDHLTIRQFVVLLNIRGSISFRQFSFVILGNVGQLLLDVSHLNISCEFPKTHFQKVVNGQNIRFIELLNDFSFSRRGERVSSLRQDLHQIVR